MSQDADRVTDLYKRHAARWAARRSTVLIERRWLDQFLDLLGPAPSVLDLGCGTGDPIARYLFERGAQVTGIDAAPDLLQRAQRQFPQGTWRQVDMRGLDLKIRFDGLLAWHSLFHLTPDAQRSMFAIFADHAAPGAALMFTTGPRAGEAMGDLEGDALYHASLDPDEYRAVLAAHGFELVAQKTEDPDCGLATIWLAQRHAGH